jgi:hypothetical protein
MAAANTIFLSANLTPPFSNATTVPWEAPTRLPPTKTQPAGEVVPTTTPEAVQLPQPEAEVQAGNGWETLQTLENAIVPEADPEDIAMRFMGIDNIPATLDEPPIAYQIGDTKDFWLMDMDTNTNFQVTTRLAYITPHSYFWIEDGVRYDERELKDLAETFENQIYPTNREFFGSEWSPGIDNDEHIYLVYARGLGFSIAGYFSSVDSVHPMANEFSNGHETFMFNADTVGLSERFTYGVLAHEFQHMIHWYQDQNETTWLNEGFSELAALLNGYYESGFDSLYFWDTDLQLNDWPNDSSATTPHYGASFLFVTYLLDRMGDDITKALVADAQNGLKSVDEIFQQFQAVDPVTGSPIGADDLFRDWSVTNYLQDGDVADGRYVYTSLPSFRTASVTDTISQCVQSVDSTVKQYGVDYYEIECDSDVVLHFQGEQNAKLLPMDAYSGQYAFWSNKGDESDMRLTRQFDLTAISTGEPVAMKYWLWYDLETDYDYVYLMISEDGEDWDFVETPRGTGYDPVGNNYGWGYNDRTGGWVEEIVDLSDYAGKEIWLRFEYVTDAAVNGEGLLLDDVSIPVIGYFSDFETDEGGWEAEGFVRINNSLPQKYLATVIRENKDGLVTVESIDLNQGQGFVVNLDFSGTLQRATLVLSGATRYTRMEADYQFWFE